MTRRFRRPNFGTLEIDVTIDDSKAYTKPFTVRVNQRIMVDGEMITFISNNNERSTDHIPKEGRFVSRRFLIRESGLGIRKAGNPPWFFQSPTPNPQSLLATC